MEVLMFSAIPGFLFELITDTESDVHCTGQWADSVPDPSFGISASISFKILSQRYCSRITQFYDCLSEFCYYFFFQVKEKDENLFKSKIFRKKRYF